MIINDMIDKWLSTYPFLSSCFCVYKCYFHMIMPHLALLSLPWCNPQDFGARKAGRSVRFQEEEEIHEPCQNNGMRSTRW